MAEMMRGVGVGRAEGVGTAPRADLAAQPLPPPAAHLAPVPTKPQQGGAVRTGALAAGIAFACVAATPLATQNNPIQLAYRRGTRRA